MGGGASQEKPVQQQAPKASKSGDTKGKAEAKEEAKATKSGGAKDENEMETFIHTQKGGKEYQVYTGKDGQRLYLNPETNDWAKFPKEWESQGKFEPFHRVTFKVWKSSSTNEEYLTFEEQGLRYYCDFQVEEWVLFPKEWLQKSAGKYISENVDPDEWAAQHQPAQGPTTSDPKVGTYTAPDNKTYTTYVGDEVIQVRYYLDDIKGQWVKMPAAWVKDMKRQEGIIDDVDEEEERHQSRAAKVLGNAEADAEIRAERLADESEQLKAQIRDLEDRLKDAQQAAALKESLAQENVKADGKMEELISSNKQLSKEKLDLKKKLKDITKQNRRMKQETKMQVQRMEQEVEKLRATGGGGGDAKMNDALRLKDQQIVKLEEQVSHLQTQLNSAKDANDAVSVVNSSLAALEVQVDALRKDKKHIYKQIRDQQEEMVSQIQETVRLMSKKLSEGGGLVNEYKAKYRAEVLKRRVLYNKLQELRGNIRVYCRVRKFLKDEVSRGFESCISFPDEGELVIKDEEGKNKSFEFDKVFDPDTTQEAVFEDMEPLITSVLDGYNVCVFAYGQTGAGKTFTMMGPPNARGVNLRSLEKLFALAEEQSEEYDWEIKVSYLELYNEMIRDLLNPAEAKNTTWGGGKGGDDKYEVKSGPNGMFVPGLTEEVVRNSKDVLSVMERGDKVRSVGATAMNEHSSRSHSLLQVVVKGINRVAGSETFGKLTLVDLAGSERVGKSKVEGQALAEAAAINKSLSCLGNVISALQTHQSHIPYRNSKLTMLLQDSLGGDAKTLMFLNINPAGEHYGESVSSLQFGQRVRSVVLGPASKNVKSPSAMGGAPGGGALPTLPGHGPVVPKIPKKG